MEYLIDILMSDNPSDNIRKSCKEIFNIIPELENCVGFNQNNIWHIYDVYEHILHVVDGVSNNLELRLAALFHDVGKPYVYTEDKDGVGHFYGHWDKSCEIFNQFAYKYDLNKDIKDKVYNLILYHDINFGKLSDEEIKKIISLFGKDGLNLLFELKKWDLLAQNSRFHYLLDDYEEQKRKIYKFID